MFSESGEERARNLFASCSEYLLRAKNGIYLDIGAGLCNNTILFGANEAEIIALDKTNVVGNVLKKKSNSNFVIGDAAKLPFREMSADLVSSFSVIEYLDPEIHLRELYRLLRFNGTLIIQFPNRHFLIEHHSGIPLFYFIPTRIRNFILKSTRYNFMMKRDVPSFKKVVSILRRISQGDDIAIKKVNYSPVLIVPPLRVLYGIMSKIGLFNVFPLGYLVILRKKNRNL